MEEYKIFEDGGLSVYRIDYYAFPNERDNHSIVRVDYKGEHNIASMEFPNAWHADNAIQLLKWTLRGMKEMDSSQAS